MLATKYHINIGDKFERLTVIGVETVKREKQRGRTKLYVCVCDCGKTSKVRASDLALGRTKSCGCYTSDLTTKRNTTHGQSKTPLYKTWKGMRERCTRPTHQFYSYYGGKGIKVCGEWMHNFVAFAEWANSHGYIEGLSIERTDINGNYCPENCTFIPLKEQALNRRNTIAVFLSRGAEKP